MTNSSHRRPNPSVCGYQLNVKESVPPGVKSSSMQFYFRQRTASSVYLVGPLVLTGQSYKAFPIVFIGSATPLYNLYSGIAIDILWITKISLLFLKRVFENYYLPKAKAI